MKKKTKWLFAGSVLLSVLGCGAETGPAPELEREQGTEEQDVEAKATVQDALLQEPNALPLKVPTTVNAMFGFSSAVPEGFTPIQFRTDWKIASSNFDIIGGTAISAAKLRDFRAKGKIFAIQTNEFFRGYQPSEGDRPAVDIWDGVKVLRGNGAAAVRQRRAISAAVNELRTRWLGFFKKNYDAIVIDEVRVNCDDDTVHAAIFSEALAATYRAKPPGKFVFVQAVEALAASGATFSQGYKTVNPDKKSFRQMLSAVQNYTDLMFIEMYRTPYYKLPSQNAHGLMKNTLAHLAAVSSVLAKKSVPMLHVSGKDVLYKYCDNKPCPAKAKAYLNQEWRVLDDVKTDANGLAYWVFYRSDHAIVSHILAHHGFR